jgi:hypothetical protein
MLISSGALELAVFRILQGHRVAAGGMVTFDELQQGWHHTGFRGPDLRDALRTLIDKGCLDCPQEGSDLVFRLTPSGEAYFGRTASNEVNTHTLEEAEQRLTQPPTIGHPLRRAIDAPRHRPRIRA